MTTTSSDLDLHAYLDRIQFGGATEPTLATLTAILGAHMARIPFENLDVLLGRRIRLDLAGLQDKLVRQRRGGYCFEHASLLAAALEKLGFRPVRHTARVTLLGPRTSTPRTHMFLTVPLAEGTFVLDPGFGAFAPRLPVPLDGSEARIGHEAHTIARDDGFFVLRAHLGEQSVDGWASTLEREYPMDFEMGNHFTATHPGSGFVNKIMMRALTPDGRVGVQNREVTIRSGAGKRTETLADRAALRALLVEYFGFDLPEVDTMRVPAIPEWGDS